MLFTFKALYRAGQLNWEYTMWKFQDFLCLSGFTWNQWWSFWTPKNCYFDQLSSSEFSAFGYIFKCEIFQNNQNSKPSELLKLQFLIVWNQPKLISRKISLNSQLGCRRLYLSYARYVYVRLSKLTENCRNYLETLLKRLRTSPPPVVN